MTISFGIGQTLGPIVVGAITDADGQPVVCAQCFRAMLALGAVLSAFQRKVRRTPNDWRAALPVRHFRHTGDNRMRQFAASGNIGLC
jgi:hypothetical protein